MTSHFSDRAMRLLSSAQRANLKRALGKVSSRTRANEVIGKLTGIAKFFETTDAWQAFHRAIDSDVSVMADDAAREYGDFQTPLSLARVVCRRLLKLGYNPTVIVEPTCGRGNFIVAALEIFPRIEKVIGLDIQERYVAECKSNLLAFLLSDGNTKREIQVQHGNIFDEDFLKELLSSVNGDVLILGNPPWVTNSALSAMNSSNLPVKSNFKKHNGFDALTGKSNFDIAEFILLQLIRNFSQASATIAMLCKNIVARNLLAATRERSLPISNIRAFTFDAAKEFNVACDASLLVAELTGKTTFTCTVSELDNDGGGTRTFGWVENQFVSDTKAYRTSRIIEGESPLVWRQGIKHDCSKVMELDSEGGILTNGFGEQVSVERDRIFPLAKSSDLKTPIITQLRKAVIVPQRTIGEDTLKLRRENPLLWKYLNHHAAGFAERKSSIYKDRPPFSIFGVGDYSFKPYKIALSGFYKASVFSLLPPLDGKPVMLDDTCYLLGFDRAQPALIALSLLNNRLVQDFLSSITFPDSKRPYTKETLMRVDLAKVSALISREEILEYLSRIGATEHEFSEADFNIFKSANALETQPLLLMERAN